MARLLDALLGAGDADVGAGVVGPRNGDLGSRPQLQLLQLLAVLPDHEAVVFLWDGDRGRGLEVSERRTNKQHEELKRQRMMMMMMTVEVL